MGAAYWVRRTALCFVCLFIALFTTVVRGGGRVYVILNILLIFLEIVKITLRVIVR